jgi:hypothetical protein
MPLLTAGLVAGWFGFRQSYERIWGNNHLCGKYTGPEANAAIGDLRVFIAARGGCFRGLGFWSCLFLFLVLRRRCPNGWRRRVMRGIGQ